MGAKQHQHDDDGDADVEAGDETEIGAGARDALLLDGGCLGRDFLGLVVHELAEVDEVVAEVAHDRFDRGGVVALDGRNQVILEA